MGTKRIHDRLSIFEWIRNFVSKNGYPPSVREIGKGNGISSTSEVLFVLDDLEEDGLIKRTPVVARGIKIISDE